MNINASSCPSPCLKDEIVGQSGALSLAGRFARDFWVVLRSICTRAVWPFDGLPINSYPSLRGRLE
jgi:hypothetical protein